MSSAGRPSKYRSKAERTEARRAQYRKADKKREKVPIKLMLIAQYKDKLLRLAVKEGTTCSNIVAKWIEKETE